MVWTLHDFDSVPLSEFNTPWQCATQANMGLLRQDGTWKPAAVIITPGTTLDLPPLPRRHRWTKPFWRMIMTMGILGSLMGGILFFRWRKRWE